MTSKLKHSTSMKIKPIPQITNLQNNLFTKLQTCSTVLPHQKYQYLDNKYLNDQPDILSDLLTKVKIITTKNKDLITKTKNKLTKTHQQKYHTFITGTNINTNQQNFYQQLPVHQQIQSIISNPKEIIDHLEQQNKFDDLQELRKLIKITDQNLGGYSKQIHQIKKQVINAAHLFKSPMTFQLSSKLKRFQFQTPFPKKTNSLAKIKLTKYH